jgi:hypothetical protein
MMIEGYRDAKSRAPTGVIVTPFTGSCTYAPGYFSNYFKSLTSLRRTSQEVEAIGTENPSSNAKLATILRTLMPPALLNAHRNGVNDKFDTSIYSYNMFRFYHNNLQASASYVQYFNILYITLLSSYYLAYSDINRRKLMFISSKLTSIFKGKSLAFRYSLSDFLSNF